MTFSDWLCDVTKRRFGGSVRKFAMRVGISGTTIYSYISGCATPTENRLCYMIGCLKESIPDDAMENYKERRSAAMKRGGTGRSDTLCWSCQNAVPTKTRGCLWSRYFRPVDGWTVERMDIGAYEGKDNTSYKVIACPEFVEDDAPAVPYSDFNVDGMEKLQNRLTELLSEMPAETVCITPKKKKHSLSELSKEEREKRRAEVSERARVRYYESRNLPVPNESEEDKRRRALYAAKRRRMYARKHDKKKKYNEEIDRFERMMNDGKQERHGDNES